MINIAVLVSGGGTNLQALIDSQNRGQNTSGKITLVVSSNESAYALLRAKAANIQTEVLLNEQFQSQDEYDSALIKLLSDYDIQLVVLAGFMTILSPKVISAFRNRIINVHPSLIPSFCGKGCYGLKVHEDALKRGVKVSGATVHFVNEICDGGEIIAQKAIEVLSSDTPSTLQARIMQECEWQILPEAVSKISEKLDN